MASRITRFVAPTSRFLSARKSGYIMWWGKSISTSQWLRTSISPWSSIRVGSLAVAIGVTAFAAGIAYNKSTSKDINYSRAFKFIAPKYGNVKDMETVRAYQLVL